MNFSCKTAIVLACAALLGACAHRGPHGHEPPRGPSAMGGMQGGAQGGMGGMHAGMHGGMQGGMQGGMGGARALAVASLGPTQGQQAQGIVLFHGQADGTVMVHARVSGLKPNAEHGFHVHENGSCASPDGNSAGGHFNPTGAPHGPQSAAHHAGDMPSLKADANGVADARFALRGVSIGSGATDLSGRAVIVHANPDDYTTQPTGNAGGRIACGVVARHP